MKISVVSGGFDPVHSGHISYINNAAKYGDKLIVALNSDEWLIKKKGKFFLPFEERKEILENLKNVDEVISFKDDDSGSVINALKSISKRYPDEQIVFKYPLLKYVIIFLLALLIVSPFLIRFLNTKVKLKFWIWLVW